MLKSLPVLFAFAAIACAVGCGTNQPFAGFQGSFERHLPSPHETQSEKSVAKSDVEPKLSGSVAADEQSGCPGLGMARWLENSNSPSAVCKTLLKDQSYFYHRDNLLPFMLTLGASSVLAHTTMDQEFADWYQDDVRSKFSDDASSFAKVFGEQWIVVPIYVGASLFGRACDVDYRVQTWGDRSFRSMLVGVPPLLLLQRSLGSSRPNDPLASSNWDMWNDDNGASGHAFVGAVPFLVAAQLTEKRVPKASFYVLSTMTAWSRINDNDHYLSQVIVGWWVALAATNAVQKSDSRGNLQIQPAFINQDGGVALSYKY